MITDLFEFLRSVALRASNAITGGVVGFAWLVYSQTTGRALPTAAFITIVACGVTWSCFAAWRELLLRVRQYETLKPEFSYQPTGSVIAVRIQMDPESNRPIVVMNFRLRFINRGSAAACNMSAQSFGCWINDEPPVARAIDEIETVGRTSPGEHATLPFLVTRPAREVNGQLTLANSDVLVLLFKLSSRAHSDAGQICEDSIWLAWDPRLPNEIGPANAHEVDAARSEISRIGIAS